MHIFWLILWLFISISITLLISRKILYTHIYISHLYVYSLLRIFFLKLDILDLSFLIYHYQYLNRHFRSLLKAHTEQAPLHTAHFSHFSFFSPFLSMKPTSSRLDILSSHDIYGMIWYLFSPRLGTRRCKILYGAFALFGF